MLVALRVNLDEMAELFFTTRQNWPYATRIAEEYLCQGLFPSQGIPECPCFRAPVSWSASSIDEVIGMQSRLLFNLQTKQPHSLVCQCGC